MRLESHFCKLHIVYHLLGLQVLGCVYPDSQFYVHQCKPGELQNLSGKPFLKLYHQSSQHAKYSFDQHSQRETSQVALEDKLHSNKQGLLCLCCHCLGLGYVMHVHSLCLPFLTSHANMQFFGPRYVMHVNSLCLPFLTSHANL